MIRSRTNQSEMVFDALSMTGEITILGGSVRQMYYTNEETYEDDRRYVPCILGGYVYVNDPSGVMNGEVTLSDIEWYTRMPIENDYSTGRITNPSQQILNDVDVVDPTTGEITHEAAWRAYDYLISDGSNRPWCSNVPSKCLIVRKNVPQLTTMSVYGVLKFVDRRTGLTVRLLKSIDFSTEVYNTEVVTIRGDGGDEIQFDPLSFTDTIPSGKTIIDIPWTRTVRAQLQGSEGDVADAEACYLWLIEESDTTIAPNGWREFDEIEVEGMSISGQKTKNLSLDVRMLNGSVVLRCYGCRRESGAAWVSPLTDENNPFYEVRLTMVLPGMASGSQRKPQGSSTQAQNILMSEGTFVAEPIQVKGNVQNTSMSIPCLYEMRLRYNGHEVPENKRSLFVFYWYGQNLKTGAVKFLGCGPTISFVPNQQGFSFPEGFVVWADVSVMTHMTVVYGYDSYNIVNGQLVGVGTPKYVVTDDNSKLVIGSVFE